MSAAASRQGWKPFAAPASIRSRKRDGLPSCTYCGACSGNGCWTDAKALVSLKGLPQAEASGNLQIRTGARALEVVIDDAGHASGVAYIVGGKRCVQRARIVLLASYVYENVRLLLLSGGCAYPRGLANDHGQVGRHFMTHSVTNVWGRFPGRRLNRGPGPLPKPRPSRSLTPTTSIMPGWVSSAAHPAGADGAQGLHGP